MTIQISLTGNLTHDPELRYTPSGTAVATVRLAHTPRRLDQNTQQWVDGETTFLSGQVWREVAEHVAESLQRGDRVIVTGSLQTESWPDRTTGEVRTRQALGIDEIGPSLRFATAKPSKARRGDAAAFAPTGEDPWGFPTPEPTNGSNVSTPGEYHAAADNAEAPATTAHQRAVQAARASAQEYSQNRS